ncbi:Exonuclease mut-7 homolog [Linum grandiflorum]
MAVTLSLYINSNLAVVRGGEGGREAKKRTPADGVRCSYGEAAASEAKEEDDRAEEEDVAATYLSSRFTAVTVSTTASFTSRTVWLPKKRRKPQEDEGSLLILLVLLMGLEKEVQSLHSDGDKDHPSLAISVHSFSDLTHISPVVFLYLLKECYVHGTCKATKKFRTLQHQVHQVLYNSPQPGPLTFIGRCLYVLPVFGEYCDGFSHLIISALQRYRKLAKSSDDISTAKVLGARLFIDILEGLIPLLDERIGIKILGVFHVTLSDMDEAISQLKYQREFRFNTGRAFVEPYIFKLVESQSYMAAVTLLEQLSIRESGRSFLLKMMDNHEYKAAEKWATFMGKQMLCSLVQEYVDRKMLKQAYDIIKKNDLKQEFPVVYLKCKESSLKKFAEKALWDLAEAKTHGDRQLLEYLVYLALEAGYTEKVDELCDRYSLEGFRKLTEPEISSTQHSRYLNLNELITNDVVWVDDADSLYNATSYIEGCKVVGVDCEWKPNYQKGSKPNRVSIMQISSEETAFVLDLIKLSEEAPDALDICLTRILQSPGILKLGYNFKCDIKQLAGSYTELNCFKQYQMLLDVQNVFKEPCGGLSGLAEKIMGAALNKTRRNSNWESRPLSPNQLEYAALDAAVLVHIFHRARNPCQSTSAAQGEEKFEWKSHIISHMDNPKKTKKHLKARKQLKQQ